MTHAVKGMEKSAKRWSSSKDETLRDDVKLVEEPVDRNRCILFGMMGVNKDFVKKHPIVDYILKS
jgi:hypothetical protein